ncbi:MAG: mechanosensitive ion channel family protein [Comamonadaceae bacterium]|nr:mechanosensitive ion channel family protein [Comamonadaceae bacterium]
MTWIHRCALALAFLSCLALPAVQAQPAVAASAPAVPNAPALAADAPLPDVESLRSQFERLPTNAVGNEAVSALLSSYAALNADAARIIAARTGQLKDLNARLGELGAAPAAGASEDPDIKRQRLTLTRERNAVDADIKLARLIVVDTQQRSEALRARERDLFAAQLTDRAASPLGGAFWRELGQAWPGDRARLAPLAAELQAAGSRLATSEHRGAVLLALALALLAITVGDLLAERGLARLARRLLPGGRLRRSLLVIAIVAVNMVVVALALQGFLQTVQARAEFGPLSGKLVALVDESVPYIVFVTSLGRALLANARPSWRLPPLADAQALRLRPYPWLVALVGVLTWVPTQVAAIVELSTAAVHASQAITAMTLVLLIAATLTRLHRSEPQGDAADPPGPRPIWEGLVLGLVVLALVGVVLLVAIGYISVASLLATQLAWTGLVGITFYVLFKFADDLFMALVSSRSDFGQRLQKGFGFAPSTLDQAAVVLSALSRVLLFLYMLIALGTQLGTRPDEVLQQTDRISAGLTIGEFQIKPAAIFSALAVLVGGFVALRVFQRWLRERYLPTTTMEPGMQSSMSTLLNYAGVVLVVAAGMSAMGIGINRIAWIASALSVGIGFGLQAIVQNFISGLILLAERPVKVGDWVILGTTEGDIKRINVRATEIQLGDRSTVIVPNSEFITKTVRNMTLTSTEGRVLIRLPMPLSTDAKLVRELMLAACRAHPGVLESPEPSLSLEGIENGSLIFQAIAYVASPRLASGVRSDLLFTILEDFKNANLPLAVPTMMMASPQLAPVGSTDDSR